LLSSAQAKEKVSPRIA